MLVRSNTYRPILTEVEWKPPGGTCKFTINMINLRFENFFVCTTTSLKDLLLVVTVINAHIQDRYQIKNIVKKVVMNGTIAVCF